MRTRNTYYKGQRNYYKPATETNTKNKKRIQKEARRQAKSQQAS